MAAIPGSVPLTGKVAPTDTTDTFATHMDIYGEGGYMAVADTATRNLITEDRRKLGMAVCTTTDNKIYTLTTNPAGATTVDGNWTEFISGSSGTQTTNIPVSAAEIAALWTTPKTLVAAPGAGKAILPMGFAIQYNYVAPIYSTNGVGDCVIHFASSSIFQSGYDLASLGSGVGDGFSATASFFQQMNQVGSTSWSQGGGTANIVANDAIQLSTIGGDAGSLTGGGSDLVIYLTYKIIDL